MGNNDLGSEDDDVSGAKKLVPLNPEDEWDRLVLGEAKLLVAWTGCAARLVRSRNGTAAGADGTIYVDREQLNKLFGAFEGEKYKTAIFFALAHEFGHLCQFKTFGVHETFSKPRIEVEAHADYLSGNWLGLRLVQGEQRLSDDLLAAGLQLKGDCEDYPSAYQRGALVQDAAGTSVTLVHILEPQIKDCDYQELASGLRDQDVRDLFGIAARRLQEIPPKQPSNPTRPYSGPETAK